MRTRPRGVAAGVIAATLCGVLTSADAAPAPVTVAGVTTFSATRPAVIRVRLPRAARVSISDVARFVARGRMNGFVLRREDGTAFMEDFRLGHCVTRGCAALFPHATATAGVAVKQRDGQWAFGLEGTLPAGTYRMYVVPDGAPLRITLKFPGLPGSRTLNVTQPARAAFHLPPPDDTFPGAGGPVEPGALYSAGMTKTLSRMGGHVVFAIWKMQAAPRQPTLADDCIYSGAVSGPHPYQQPCSGQSTVPYVTGNTGTGQAGPTPLGGYITSFSGSYEFFAADESQTLSLGAYSNSAGPSDDAHLLEFWIDY